MDKVGIMIGSVMLSATSRVIWAANYEQTRVGHFIHAPQTLPLSYCVTTDIASILFPWLDLPLAHWNHICALWLDLGFSDGV